MPHLLSHLVLVCLINETTVTFQSLAQKREAQGAWSISSASNVPGARRIFVRPSNSHIGVEAIGSGNPASSCPKGSERPQHPYLHEGAFYIWSESCRLNE